MRPKPLSGIRVLDLTRLLPGPVCTLHLADLGADVIKVEDTGAGDYARSLGVCGGIAPVFLAINRNKRSLRLDLKRSEGVEIFLRLVGDAQVVVESFRPGVVDRLGVGYAACNRVNPRIVYCSISGYGQTGPYRDLAGHDINYCSYAGLTDQIGVAGSEEPAIPNLQIADILGGAVVPAMAILAALFDAVRTGQGRFVDVAMTEGVLAHNLQALAAVALEGRARPMGEDFLTGREPCYAVYRCADGRYIAVGALEKKFWDGVCDVLGRPDLKPHHWSLGGGDREGTKRALREIFANRPQSYWVEKFANVDCCVTPVLRLVESLNHPQIAARKMVLRAPHPRAGEMLQFAPPFKMSEYFFEVVRPAPGAGEHSEELLREAGYADAEIARLRADRVI